MHNRVMPRAKRQDHKGAWHHVMNRGTRKSKTFLADRHCSKFLEIVGEAVDRYGLEVHAYSLMPNHYHLLVRSPLGNLSRCMRHINGTYTLWFNKVQRLEGPVFRGRFKSQLVEDEEYLRILIAYIHLNPIAAHLVRRLDSDAWTSHRAYIGRDSVPSWLTTEVLLDLFNGKSRLHDFVRSVHTKAVKYPEDFNPETGLFKKKAITRRVQQANCPAKPTHLPTRFRSPDKVLQDVCQITGANLTHIKKADKGPRANPARRFAIWALYWGAGLKHREIAQKLHVPLYQVSKLLSRLRKGTKSQPLRQWMDEWLTRE